MTYCLLNNNIQKERPCKILITGGKGQLAQALCHHRDANAFQVIACSRQELDITNKLAVQEALKLIAPDMIINTASYTAVDRAEHETEQAIAINHLGACQLAIACEEQQLPLVHISTDYLFDGRKTVAYQETDPVNPLNQYGKSKWLGEQAVREHCDQHIIVRTSGVFSEYGHNFLKTILRLAKEQPEFHVVNDQVTCPTYADNLASAIYAIAKQIRLTPREQRWGTYHYCDAEPMSWYEFAYAIVNEVQTWPGFCVQEIKPIATADYAAPAARPAFSVLDCKKMETIYGIKQASWQDNLSRILKRLQ